MDVDRIFAELVHESEEIMNGMRDWQTAHPHVTFAEIKRPRMSASTDCAPACSGI